VGWWVVCVGVQWGGVVGCGLVGLEGVGCHVGVGCVVGVWGGVCGGCVCVHLFQTSGRVVWWVWVEW
jgi:hypothetical protein